MTYYGVMTDYEWRAGHKTDRLTVWSGSFMSNRDAEAISLPKRDGYMLHLEYGGKVRVTCPVPRDDANYREIDAAINVALNDHYKEGS